MATDETKLDEELAEVRAAFEKLRQSPDESPVETLMTSARLKVQSAKVVGDRLQGWSTDLAATLAELEEPGPEILRSLDLVLERVAASRKSLTDVENALIELQNCLIAYALAHQGRSEA